MGELEQKIKAYGKELGFDLVGITTADPFVRDESVSIKRIRQGLMTGLPWYTEERVHLATHPEKLLQNAKSIISLAISYNTGNPKNAKHEPMGKIARYAWGEDYHLVLKDKLRNFVKGLSKHINTEFQTRIFVDDGPMNDRAAAERSGLGWFGKNTNILTISHGSWVLLGQVITDLELEPDTALAKNCGNCVRCIDDCPTGAIIAPYVIDNNRCISFLTIELRGSIPRKLRTLIGDWVFGCDICQDVCPVNRKVEISREPAFRQRHDFAAPALIPLLHLDDESFRSRFKNSPIKRAKRVGLQRNVCVALGNIGDPTALPALMEALNNDNPIIREHAAWAIGKIGKGETIEVLKQALVTESDPIVLKELELTIADIRTNKSNAHASSNLSS